MTRCLIIPLLRPLAIATILLAAVNAAAEAPEVRFLAESFPIEYGDIVVVAGDTVSHPFSMPTSHLSGAVPAPAREFELQSADTRRQLARITLPAAGERFICLLLPETTDGFLPDPEAGFVVVVLSADDPAFRAGDYYFYNHTPEPVTGSIGSVTFSLPPAQGCVVRPADAGDERLYQVSLGVGEEPDTSVLTTTRWPVDKAVRNYIFFVVDPRTGRIAFRAVDEFVPAGEGG